ncbi:MAG: prephenate dehydratase [Bacteroidota bacterium]|nr:prephenate dehydratase [Bacteroidota bacterium]MXW83243.1 prephenate dehydratase [Rhodothermaceae bacterium]MYD18016.1 prephenate dehydratase [Rhodothermaceae bacterium]MYD56654.1 prephenate dehydratase [Rhodothermaceae bacterium]MYI42479.1 prephenate dehydratase [Rhodothermaceae bacterium]
MKIAFQGEIGAFSEEAAGYLYPGCDVVPLPSMEDVFIAVENQTVARGIIPIENSLFGSVHINYDHLRNYRVKITGEAKLRIRHYLMAKPGAHLEGIKRVLSHPQALGQCQVFLREKLGSSDIVPTYDTAGAAKLVAAENSLSSAAIGPARAALEYGLQILAEDLQSHALNYTRFLALAPEDAPRLTSSKEPLKTSIVFTPKENVPGALFKSLAVFFLRDLDLYKVESRPLIGRPGAYLFYLDVEGDVESPILQRALEHLNEISADLRVLGSYPRGQTWNGEEST